MAVHPGNTALSMTCAVKVVGDGLNLGPLLNPVFGSHRDKESAGSCLQGRSLGGSLEVCIKPDYFFF